MFCIFLVMVLVESSDHLSTLTRQGSPTRIDSGHSVRGPRGALWDTTWRHVGGFKVTTKCSPRAPHRAPRLDSSRVSLARQCGKMIRTFDQNHHKKDAKQFCTKMISEHKTFLYLSCDVLVESSDHLSTLTRQGNPTRIDSERSVGALGEHFVVTLEPPTWRQVVPQSAPRGPSQSAQSRF